MSACGKAWGATWGSSWGDSGSSPEIPVTVEFATAWTSITTTAARPRIDAVGAFQSLGSTGIKPSTSITTGWPAISTSATYPTIEVIHVS